MSKRIVISETEKNRIKSLYMNEDVSSYGRKLNLDKWTEEERKFEINNHEYLLSGGIHDDTNKNKWILHTNEVNPRTGDRKVFSGEQKFVFNCNLTALYGYDGDYMQGKKFESISYPSVKKLISKLKEQLCQ